MKNAAFLVASLATLVAGTSLAGCTDDGIAASPEDPTAPIQHTITSTAGDAPVIVANGGALAITIADQTAIGLDGKATAGFAVEPLEVNRWPNTISTDYLVRANVAGTGSYEIATSKGIAAGLVRSADVAHVALVPARYELDGHSPFALSSDRTQVAVALFDANGRRLVDATLAIGEDGSTQTAWDTARLATKIGMHSLAITGDSLSARTLSVEVVEGVDRIESSTRGDRTCYHAYRGDTEVVVGTTFFGGAADPTASNCALTPIHATPNGLAL